VNGITAIYFEDRNSTSPARANRYTGEVFLNSNIWNSLTPERRFFVLCHELGHLKHNTTDELYADESAFYDYVKKNKSLKESVKALSQVLNFDNPEHYDRLLNQLKRALKYDFEHNHNHKAMKVLNNLQEANENVNLNRDVFVDEVEFCNNNDCETEFLGFGKKAKERRQATRTQRQESRQKRIETKMSYRQKIAEAGGGVGGFLKGALSAIGGSPTVTDESGIEKPVQPNPMSLIMIIAVFIIIIVIILFATGVFKKKKKA